MEVFDLSPAVTIIYHCWYVYLIFLSVCMCLAYVCFHSAISLDMTSTDAPTKDQINSNYHTQPKYHDTSCSHLKPSEAFSKHTAHRPPPLKFSPMTRVSLKRPAAENGLGEAIVAESTKSEERLDSCNDKTTMKGSVFFTHSPQKFHQDAKFR